MTTNNRFVKQKAKHAASRARWRNVENVARFSQMTFLSRCLGLVRDLGCAFIWGFASICRLSGCFSVAKFFEGLAG